MNVGRRHASKERVLHHPFADSYPFEHGGSMNYQKHYDLLIEKYGSWLKPKDVYTERHRKLPGNVGGKYVEGNAFYMSARAHFVAHLLLAKITSRPEDWAAVKGMCEFRHKRSSRLYEVARRLARPAMIKNGSKAGKLTASLGYLKIASANSVESQRKNGFNMFHYDGYSKELHKRISSRAGKTTRDLGYLKIAGEKSYESKAGFHSLSAEDNKNNASLGGKASGNKCKEQSLGICGLSYEERKQYGALGGKVAGKLLWWYNSGTEHCMRALECPAEGYVRGRKSWKNV